MPFNRKINAPERNSDEHFSEWRATLIAPDGREICETFEGSRGDRAAWNRAIEFLMHGALPQMHAASGAGGLCDMTERARSRFHDALLSHDGEIVVICDPWQMRLEHTSSEDTSHTKTPIAAVGGTMAAFGFLAAIGNANPFM